MVKSGDILAEIDNGRVKLDPFDREMVQPSSIDVRLDRYFRVFENHRYPHIDPAEDQPDLTRLVEVEPELVPWPMVAEVEPEPDVGSESSKPRNTATGVLKRSRWRADEPSTPRVNESHGCRLHRESDAAEPDRTRIQEIEKRGVQLVAVLDLRERDALTLGGVARGRRAGIAALRYVDGARLEFSEVESRQDAPWEKAAQRR